MGAAGAGRACDGGESERNGAETHEEIARTRRQRQDCSHGRFLSSNGSLYSSHAATLSDTTIGRGQGNSVRAWPARYPLTPLSFDSTSATPATATLIPTLVDVRATVLLTLGIVICGCSHASKSASAASKPTDDLHQLAAVIADSTGMGVQQAVMNGGTGELRITVRDYPIAKLDSTSRSDVARGVALFARAHYARMSSVSYIRVVFVSTKDRGSVRAANEVYETGWPPAQLNPPRAQVAPPSRPDRAAH